jgi:hypothetical protein
METLLPTSLVLPDGRGEAEWSGIKFTFIAAFSRNATFHFFWIALIRLSDCKNWLTLSYLTFNAILSNISTFSFIMSCI